MLKKIKTIIFVLIGLYLLFAVGFGIIPYAIPKEVSEEMKPQFDVNRFYGADEQGVDRLTLAESPQSGFDSRIRLIREAQTSIDLVCHCVKDGITSEQIFAELLDAADRGVQVRVVLDGKVGGLSGSRKGIAYALSAHPNVQYRVYNPFCFYKPWEWNALLHDKILIGDDRVMILGGRNIGDAYFAPEGYTGKVTNDRDVVVYNTASGAEQSGDSVLSDAKAYFNEIWSCEAVKEPFPTLSESQKQKADETAAELKEVRAALMTARPELYGEEPYDYANSTVPAKQLTLIHNPLNAGPKEPWVGVQLANLGLTAKESVTMQSPYCTANKRLLSVMKSMAATLPEVILQTNSVASSPNYPAFSNYIENRKKFIDTGITIRELQSEDSIHGKSFLMDGRLSAVGSFNLDDRSMYIDTEAMLVIDSPEFYEQLKAAMDSYGNQSLTVSSDNSYEENADVTPLEVPWWKRTLMWLASLISRPFQFLI